MPDSGANQVNKWQNQARAWTRQHIFCSDFESNYPTSTTV
jgi:hypothetical protein